LAVYIFGSTRKSCSKKKRLDFVLQIIRNILMIQHSGLNKVRSNDYLIILDENLSSMLTYICVNSKRKEADSFQAGRLFYK